MGIRNKLAGQCRKPEGWIGRFFLRAMNAGHSKLTDWGLEQISVGDHDTILDVGCGGGGTLSKLAGIASEGKIHGIDYSETSVAAAQKKNARLIETGRVEIQQASVSRLPFPDNTFDLITAVETHFFWPDLPANLGEVQRVLKPGGTLLIVAEVYRGGKRMTEKMVERVVRATGMTLLTLEEHKELLERTGYSDVRVMAKPDKGWMCCSGRKLL